MALLKELKGSFVGGKISRSLQNRIDLEKFNTWLKEAKNTQIKPEGSVSNRAGTVYVGTAKDSVYKLTINVNVSATIIINGVTYTGTSVTVDLPVDDASYEYSVGAEGYVTQSDSGTITQNTVKEITLEESLVQYTYTIVNTQGATITINGVEQSTITANSGTLIEWEVSKEGYTTQEGSFILSADKTDEIELEEYVIVFIKVTATPSDSLISVNNQIISSGESAEVEKNTSVTVTISKTGYIPYEETFTATEDKEIEFDLSPSTIHIQNIKNPNETGTYEQRNYYKVYDITLYKAGAYRIELGGAKGRRGTKGGFIIAQKEFNANDVLEVWAIGGYYEKYASSGGLPSGWFCGAVSLKVNGNYVVTAGGGADASWSSQYNQGTFYSGSGYKAGDFVGNLPSGTTLHRGVYTGSSSWNTGNVEADGDGQSSIANGITAYGGTSNINNVLYTIVSRGRHEENAYAKIIYIG